MLHNRYFRIQFVLICIIAALHVGALTFFWYWEFPWFDIVMHFLGGVWVSISALWMLFFSPWRVMLSIRPDTVLVVAVIATLGIGIGWEVFEYVFGLTVGEANYVTDTTADILMDVAGALCAFAYVLIRERV